MTVSEHAQVDRPLHQSRRLQYKAYIQCHHRNCPLPTVNNPTINNNHIAGAFYTDIGGSLNLPDGDGFQQRALFQDRQSDGSGLRPMCPQRRFSLAFIGNGVNPYLYDVLGRTYHLGLRFQ